jgi:hypothetical protein
LDGATGEEVETELEPEETEIGTEAMTAAVGGDAKGAELYEDAE